MIWAELLGKIVFWEENTAKMIVKYFAFRHRYEKIIILVEGSIASVLARNFREDTRIDL